ncbi:uncharacterized protein [Physcomitrium patens]|uniref:uncharacterized protein isoform X6 n=1 Tax=Physcomitrium patens TaxID=3218 RepID=UPI000D1600EC|nr:uncharacterized protein LOC112278232 isoform X2 [Physcomitrium patens]|eukprot:XP_024367190.1 uncharacterized protein LOC112278232 isoform X2 [Physcomitrella patens]
MKEICQNWVFVFGLPNYRRSWKCPVQDFHSNLLACNYAGWLWRSLKLGALARQSMTFSVTEWAQEVEVEQLIYMLISGECKNLRYVPFISLRKRCNASQRQL